MLAIKGEYKELLVSMTVDSYLKIGKVYARLQAEGWTKAVLGCYSKNAHAITRALLRMQRSFLVQGGHCLKDRRLCC